MTDMTDMTNLTDLTFLTFSALVAELVDALDSKSSGSNTVSVRFRSGARQRSKAILFKLPFFFSSGTHASKWIYAIIELIFSVRTRVRNINKKYITYTLLLLESPQKIDLRGFVFY
jgi:hypothetical protein